MRIAGFLDFKGSELEQQIEVAKQLDIKNMLVRNIGDKNITELEDEEIKEIFQILRTEKLNILALDPLIESYNLYDIEKYQETFELYKKAIDICKRLRVTNLYLRLPKIDNIIDEFNDIENQLTPIVDYASRNNVTLLIYSEGIKANVIVYLLKHYKSRHLSFIFNPKQQHLNKESSTVAYRLLRNDTKFFMASDLDEKNNPELLGYGKLNIIDMFKRLNRDKFNGFIILDDSFNDFILGDHEEKRPWYKRIFRSKDKLIQSYLQKYAHRIYPGEPDHEVDIIDIYLNQIQVLNVVFNLGR